jgi:hypothetical protein
MWVKWVKVQARHLKPGDLCLNTKETVVRTFKDKLTDEGKIAVLFERSPDQNRDDQRLSTMREVRPIAVLRKE